MGPNLVFWGTSHFELTNMSDFNLLTNTPETVQPRSRRAVKSKTARPKGERNNPEHSHL